MINSQSQFPPDTCPIQRSSAVGSLANVLETFSTTESSHKLLLKRGVTQLIQCPEDKAQLILHAQVVLCTLEHFQMIVTCAQMNEFCEARIRNTAAFDAEFHNQGAWIMEKRYSNS